MVPLSQFFVLWFKLNWHPQALLLLTTGGTSLVRTPTQTNDFLEPVKNTLYHLQWLRADLTIFWSCCVFCRRRFHRLKTELAHVHYRAEADQQLGSCHLLSSSTWYLPSFIFYHLQLGTCHLVIFLTSLPRLLFLNTTKNISTSLSYWDGSSYLADTGHHFDNPVYSTFRASPSLCTTSTPLNNARLHNRSQEHGRGHFKTYLY